MAPAATRGGSGGSPSGDRQRLRSRHRPDQAVASFSILGDMARQIGGDRVEVVTLVGPNGDAHVYQPTPTDAKHLSEAKVLVSTA